MSPKKTYCVIAKYCQKCQKVFLSWRSANRKFCSKECSDIGRKVASGEDHFYWKGNKAGRLSLHEWVRKQMIKAGRLKKCEHCGSEKNIDLSNKDYKYGRDLSGWQWLCRSCHFKYDKIGARTWKTKYADGFRLTRNSAGKITGRIYV